MSAPTCSIPAFWSLGAACSSLCALAGASGREQRARFNWVLLVARPGLFANDLADRYWEAIRQGRDRTDDLVLPLAVYNPFEAAQVQAHADRSRRRLNRERRA